MKISSIFVAFLENMNFTENKQKWAFSDPPSPLQVLS